MAALKRKEAAEAMELATQQALICAPPSPCKSSPQQVSKTDNNSTIDVDCRLLSLSPEVRGRIYHYAMCNDFLASLQPVSSRYPDAVKTRAKTPALMRTCSQMRIEAGGIWYSQTVFIYRQDAVLYKWLQLIGPANQKVVRTVRRDNVMLNKRWAEAYVTFTHARLKDQKLFLAEDAIEVACWEPQARVNVTEIEESAPIKEPEVEKFTAVPDLVATATAALEFKSEDPDEAEMLFTDEVPGGVYTFDSALGLDSHADNFSNNAQDDETMADSETIRDSSLVPSVANSKSSATSVTSSSMGDEKKKKAKKSQSNAGSVAESVTSTKDGEKKKKAEKAKKSSPSSLAESVMSTKSGSGEKSKDKKPTKPKVKKEPEAEKTWAFVRMETASV